MNQRLTLKIADIALELVTKEENLYKYIQEHYLYYLSSNRPKFILDIKINDRPWERHVPAYGLQKTKDGFLLKEPWFRGSWDDKHQHGELILHNKFDFISLSTFIRILYAQLLYQEGGLLLHASGVVENDVAYVFSGPSGAGKSTVVQLSIPRRVLSEETVFIKPGNNNYLAYPTPTWNEEIGNRMESNKGFPIRGLFYLVKDEDIFLESITCSRAIAEFFTVFMPGTNLDGNQYLARFSRFLNIVPCYKLHFTKNPSFWRYIYDRVNNQSKENKGDRLAYN